MHNNFLVERRSGDSGAKMSKSSGEFLRLQLLIDKGYHPLAYRMMCLQAHYRSELEFSWEGLRAALVRLKRLVMGLSNWRDDVAFRGSSDEWRADIRARFAAAVSDDLNTSVALTILEEAVAKKGPSSFKADLVDEMDKVLGFGLGTLTSAELRIRPKEAMLDEDHIAASIEFRKEARAQQNYAMSDRLRDQLAAQGVEVMDGDPLGWDWKLGT